MIIDTLFIMLGFFAILGALVVLLSKQPLYSALGLLMSILSVAGLYMLLSGSFLFMAQVIVYAGAVMTLFLFILMFLNIGQEHLPSEPKKGYLIAAGVLLVTPINWLILRGISTLPGSNMGLLDSDFGDIGELGLVLFTKWLLPFELISVLLLVALIGVVALAKRKPRREVKS